MKQLQSCFSKPPSGLYSIQAGRICDSKYRTLGLLETNGDYGHLRLEYLTTHYVQKLQVFASGEKGTIYPGLNKLNTIMLERGVTHDIELEKWHKWQLSF